MDKFLGHDIKYWIELEKRAEELAVTDFIKEIADLRGKVSFYEDRIIQMVELANKK